MYDRLRYWLGAEPFLGIVVLAVSIPLVATIAYIAIYGVIASPWVFLSYLTLWSLPILLAYLDGRASKKFGKGVVRALRIMAILGITAWWFRDEFIPWRGLTTGMIFPVSFTAFLIIFLLRSSGREDEISALPNYRDP